MLRAAILATTLLFAADARASSIRCGNSLVGTGQGTHELITKCGQPAYVSHRTVVTPGLTPESRIYEDIETWTYPGGPGEMVRSIEIRRGVILDVAVLGHKADPSRCESVSFAAASTSAQVELACGAPVTRNQWVEERRYGRSKQLISHERWVYDLGPGRFLRIVEIEDGRVLKVSTGSRSP